MSSHRVTWSSYGTLLGSIHLSMQWCSLLLEVLKAEQTRGSGLLMHLIVEWGNSLSLDWYRLTHLWELGARWARDNRWRKRTTCSSFSRRKCSPKGSDGPSTQHSSRRLRNGQSLGVYRGGLHYNCDALIYTSLTELEFDNGALCPSSPDYHQVMPKFSSLIWD